jgi:hypothetical protein
MFRRIEIIQEPEKLTELEKRRRERNIADGDATKEDYKSRGIMGLCFCDYPEEAMQAWINLPGPKKRIRKNVRFYFTEKGWDKYGRATVKALMRTGTKYRVIVVEEHDVSVQYRDEWQVTIFAKRKGRK